MSKNAVTGTLLVTFQNGRAYTYTGVPPAIVVGFERAPSAVSSYDANIRGRY
ncbi:KTSC domain-containing protein [Acetobacter thailandicus]|uniref:KTSC domain-containing protein n=1 Tax=Acetobacter thailandicus TaxID=1502842 RepID=UPI0038D18177